MRESHRLKSLDGLRGIAACVVVVCHLQGALNGGDPAGSKSGPNPGWGWFYSTFLMGFQNGIAAVWLFWIMSGFVLSFQFFLRSRVVSPSTASDYLEAAALRRYPRLLPPVLLAVLLTCLMIKLGWMKNVALAEHLGLPRSDFYATRYDSPISLVGALKFAAYQTFFWYKPKTSYGLVFWTMEKEFYGSLFLFGVLAIFGQRRCRAMVYAILFVANYCLYLLWLNSFVVGILLCDIYTRRITSKADRENPDSPAVSPIDRPLIALALWMMMLFGYGFYQANESIGREFSYLLLGTAAVWLALNSRASRSFLGSPIPAYLGKISFGLYLIHDPLINSVGAGVYLRSVGIVGGTNAKILMTLSTFFVSIVGGHLLYLIADRPAMWFSRVLSDRLIEWGDRLTGRLGLEPGPGIKPSGHRADEIVRDLSPIGIARR